MNSTIVNQRIADFLDNNDYLNFYEIQKENIPDWYHKIRLKFIDMNLEFPINEQEAKSNDCHIFFTMAENGHLHILKWLHKTFHFTEEEIKYIIYNLFLCLIVENHLYVLKWLHDTFKFTKDEIQLDSYGAFDMAINENNLDILQWLHITFGLSESFIKDNNCEVLLDAITLDCLEVTKWLCQTFPLTIHEITYIKDYLYSPDYHLNYNYNDTTNWFLYDKYNLV